MKNDLYILRRAVKALCNEEHEEGKCQFPDCDCPALFKEDYRRQAHAVIVALRRANLLKED